MQATQEQIQEWKDKYGGVYELPIEDKSAFLKEPKMQDFKRAFTAMQKGGDIAFGEEMINALWIDGDEEIRKDDEYFLPARKELVDFFNYPDAVIKKKGTGHEITIEDFKCVVRVITREDIRLAEKKNPANKPFQTQEHLFDMIVTSKDEAFNDKNNPEVRFPLYQAIEKLQNQKIGRLKKL
ncbi:hypothetical protein [Epilithonimonas arachidiradicis]|uniref:Uncharacterized protein n=1 Tax=Epilithonimonas arachidiradicis TaxID=1617282 RepID=A0A420DDZ7_9FLAO|nr:hypothetical protein [Epilithonimonas arachidiradicis]RKE90006.1 hypothetical protein BXY58_0591 [Epilithonimonas arachidiradicis]GGG47033.1 hypothetical protein GCM10007332_05660 [Epilithonimonas arachidiradicis]